MAVEAHSATEGKQIQRALDIATADHKVVDPGSNSDKAKSIKIPIKTASKQKRPSSTQQSIDKKGTSKSGQTFTGTGPAMARDNPDA
jgi:hypothetical protein